jgi:hypothetical protein
MTAFYTDLQLYPSIAALGLIRVTRQVGQQFEELIGLTDEEPVLDESVDGRHRPSLFVRGRADDRNGRELPAQERARFRHDQVGLEILAAERRGIEIREHELRIFGVGQGLEVGCLGRTDAEQDPQPFKIGDLQGQNWVEAAAACSHTT